MRNTSIFKNKKVVIVGLARSGLSCANLLYSLGADVSITDNKDCESTRFNAAKLKSKNIKIELGEHSLEFIKGNDLMVISPGIENSALPVIWAGQFKIPILSEIEIAWVLCPASVIAVTGSNGKTTVTTLIGKIIEASARSAFVCGNIGNPFSGEVEKMSADDFVSLEISSFQLERIEKFKPKIAVILNFTRNHLDRYKDMQEYLEAKKRIFMNQEKDDYLVLNGEDPVLREIGKEARSNVVYFKNTPGLSLNQSVVLCVGSILGIDRELCLEVFKNFKGVEHRQEYVTEIKDIRFINDSKATTVESAIYAIQNIDRPIILIAGGKDKGLDYSDILDSALTKVREVILIGEAKEKIRQAIARALPTDEAVSLDEAVQKAYLKARPGDCILLSPMCSSFDMFANYEERGRVFKKAVLDLAKQKG